MRTSPPPLPPRAGRSARRPRPPLGALACFAFVGGVGALAARAGCPRPALYVIHEDQPNAFATGRSPERAAVAVHPGPLATMSEAAVAGRPGPAPRRPRDPA